MKRDPKFRHHVYSLTDGGWYWMDWDTLTPHGPHTSSDEALLACKQSCDDFNPSRVLLSLRPTN
jgi:hypothetical protein